MDFHFFDSINEIKAIWDDNCPDIIFWKSAFHQTLEDKGPKGLIPLYCIVKSNNEAIGLLYFQHKNINLGESIRFKNRRWYNPIIYKLFLNNLQQDTLVLGNILVTGNYGIFLPQLAARQKFEVAELGINKAINYIKLSHKKKIGPILIKDFFTEDVETIDHFIDSIKFKVQPNMIFHFDPSWKTMDDYVAAIKAKPRTKFNKIKSNFLGIQSKHLSIEEIENYRNEMHELYLNISSNAGFNLFYLDKNYFHTLKKYLGDKLIIKGYFNAERLIGFSTMIHHHAEIDAHFLGYDFESNKQYHLYLNMLYDMIEFGIEMRASKIIMSRTAMEIKSSVGAKPYEMFCFLSNTSKLFNLFTPSVVRSVYKDVVWEERNPFK
jgi:hypothetical protein